MSGGYFDYNHFRLHDIAQSIKYQIEKNGAGYSEETLDEFRKAVHYLRVAEIYSNRIDYLLCGDDGEEGFHRRLKEDLSEIGGEENGNN